jgi:hypothetical protein
MNNDIPGKYIRKKNRSHFLELKPDGNYFLFEGSPGVTGRYEVNGDEITIIGEESTSRAKIQDGVITDTEGDKWILRKPTDQATTAVDDDPLPSMTWLPAILRREDFPWELVEAAGLVVVVVVALLVAAMTRK